MQVFFHNFRCLTLAALLLSGCSGGLASHLPSWSMAEADQTSYETPHQRIERLQEAAIAHARATVQEQERFAAELAQQVRDEADPIIREQIVRALEKIPAATATSVIQAALHDPDTQVRIAAIETIARRGGSGTIEVLSGVLQGDGNIDVRLAAARALGELQDPAAMQALALALESPDPALQYRAMQALKQTTGQDLGDDVEAWRQYARSGNPPTRQPFSVVDAINKLRFF